MDVTTPVTVKDSNLLTEMDVTTPVTVKDSNLLTETNDAPFGDDDAYFKFLEDRYKKQTTVKRQKEIN